MTIYVDYEADTILEFDYKYTIDKCINESLLFEKCPYDIELNIVLTDNETICSVNNEYRGIDSPTDVLSFPLVEYDYPSDFSRLEKCTDCFNPETGELLLGDIMISVDKVISQAEDYGHSYKRELAFLVVHSMLHLFGYDHMEDDERIIMEDRQKAILNNIGILRVMT